MPAAAPAAVSIPAYEIMAFHERTGQLVVRFEGIPQSYAIDLPVDGGRYPVGRELDVFVAGFFPRDVLIRARALSAGVANSGELKKLVKAPARNQQSQSPAQAPDWF